MWKGPLMSGTKKPCAPPLRTETGTSTERKRKRETERGEEGGERDKRELNIFNL